MFSHITSNLQPGLALTLCLVMGGSASGQAQVFLNRAASGANFHGRADFPWQCRLTEDAIWNKHMQDGFESYQDSNYLKAANSFQEAVKRARSQKLILDCQAGSLYQLGLAWERAGKLIEAEQAWTKLLSLDKTGSNLPDAMRAYLDLGPLYEKLNRPSDAEVMYKRLLRIEEQTLGSDNPEIARSLNALAAFYERHQRPKDALSLYSRVLSIKKLSVPNRKCDPYVATIAYRLAKRYQEARALDQASRLFQAAIDCRKIYPGRHNLDLADALMSMGQCCAAQGYNSRAERLLLESLSMRIDSLGPTDQQIATVSDIVGQFYLSIGQSSRAKAFFSKSLQILEQLLGPADPALGNTLLSLAKAQARLGAFGQAENSLKRVITISQGDQENIKFRKALALLTLSNLYLTQDKIAGATQCLASSLELFKALHLPAAGPAERQLIALRQYASFGIDDLHRLGPAMQLAQVLMDSDESFTALSILDQAIGKVEKNNHPLTVPLLLKQAGAYQKLGELARAEGSALKAQSIVEKQRGKDCPGMAAVCITLARLYSPQNKTRQAAANYERALGIYEKINHPHTSILAREYAYMRTRANQAENAGSPTDHSVNNRPPSP